MRKLGSKLLSILLSALMAFTLLAGLPVAAYAAGAPEAPAAEDPAAPEPEAPGTDTPEAGTTDPDAPAPATPDPGEPESGGAPEPEEGAAPQAMAAAVPVALAEDSATSLLSVAGQTVTVEDGAGTQQSPYSVNIAVPYAKASLGVGEIAVPQGAGVRMWRISDNQEFTQSPVPLPEPGWSEPSSLDIRIEVSAIGNGAAASNYRVTVMRLHKTSLLQYVAGQTIVTQSGLGTPQSPYTGYIVVPGAISAITPADLAPTEGFSTINGLYSDSGFQNRVTTSISLAAGSETHIYAIASDIEFGQTAYYNITVTRQEAPLSQDAGLISVAGQPIVAVPRPGYADSFTAAIVVPYAKSSISTGDVAVPAGAVAALFQDSGYSQNITSMNLSPGQTKILYVRVTAEDISLQNHYAVSVTRQDIAAPAISGQRAVLPSPFAANILFNLSADASVYLRCMPAGVPAPTANDIKQGASRNYAAGEGLEWKLDGLEPETAYVAWMLAENSFGASPAVSVYFTTRRLLSGGANIISVAGQNPYLSGAGLGPAQLRYATVRLAYGKTTLSASEIVVSPGASLTWHTDSSFTTIRQAPDAPLNTGSNDFYFKVLAEDSMTARYYRVTITRSREPSDLALILSAAGVSPRSTGPLPYQPDQAWQENIAVPYAKTKIARDDFVVSAGATFTLRENRQAFEPIEGLELAVGANKLWAEVTAEDGNTVYYYDLTITRAAAGGSVAAELLSVNGYAPGITSGAGTRADPKTGTIEAPNTESIILPGDLVVSPNATAVLTNSSFNSSLERINLVNGVNPVHLRVTAQDGATVVYYYLLVTRAPSDGTPPRLLSVTPSGANAPLSGSLVLTFSEPMDPHFGWNIACNGLDFTPPANGWSAGNRVFTVDYEAQAAGSCIPLDIRNFSDATGCYMLPDSTWSFTTAAGTGADTTPPLVWMNSGSHTTSAVTATGGTVHYYSSEAGTCYYTAFDWDTDPWPVNNSGDLKALNKKGTAVAGHNTLKLSGLAPNKGYFVAITVADKAGNLSSDWITAELNLNEEGLDRDAALVYLAGYYLPEEGGSGTQGNPGQMHVTLPGSMASLTPADFVTRIAGAQVLLYAGEDFSGQPLSSVFLAPGLNEVYVKVTSADGGVTSYYRISIIRQSAASADARLLSVAGQLVTAGSQPGTGAEPKTAAVTLPYSKTTITAQDLTPAPGATAALYTGSSYQNVAESVSVGTGAETHLYAAVTAEDGASTLFYDIALTRTATASGDAGLLSVAGQAVAAGAQPGTSENPKTAGITVPFGKRSITRADIEAAPLASFLLFTDNTFSNTALSTPLGTGETPVYIGVTAEDHTTRLYYAVTVTREAPVISVSLAPSHAILADVGHKVNIRALLSDGVAASELDVKIDPADPRNDPAALGAVDSSWNAGSALFTIQPKAAAWAAAPPATLYVTARYTVSPNEIYTATATVELMPGSEEDTTARLLENTITVNKALENGALLPVLITRQSPAEFSMLMAAAASPPPATGSQVVAGVGLFTQAKDKTWSVPVSTFEARMYPEDNRYIEIFALPTAKTINKVMVVLSLQGGGKVEAGTLKLTATEKYPKVTLKAENPNLAFPTRPAALSATSAEGACTIVSVTPAKAADSGKLLYANGAFTLGNIAKAATVPMSVLVKVEGYKTPPVKNAVKLNVKVTDALPKLKLSAANLTLLEGELEAKLDLLSSDKNLPFQQGYTVSGVEISATDAKGKAVKNPANVEVSYKAGVIGVAPRPDSRTGPAMLKVSFANSPKALYLKLNVTLLTQAQMSKITLTPGLKAATVHTAIINGGTIAVIPIRLSAANFTTTDWKIQSVSGVKDFTDFTEHTLGGAIGIIQYDNQLTLEAYDLTKLQALCQSGKSTTYTLKIGAASITDTKGKIKTFDFKLTVTNKDPAMTVSLKNKIDVTNPASAATATVKLTNMGGEIEYVKLYDQVMNGKLIDLTATMAGQSADFEADVTGANSFTIRLNPQSGNQVAPGVKRNLSAVVTLKNGLEMATWNDALKDRPIAITPVQGGIKASQSTKAVTLYKGAPKSGARVSLVLTAPAGAQLGVVRIADSTSNLKLGFKGQSAGGAPAANGTGFELVRSGSDDWSIQFAGGKLPEIYDKNGKAGKLKANYTLKLEIWAIGTYQLEADGATPKCDPSGRPLPLGTTNSKGKFTATTKPITVSVNVTVK